MSLFSALRDSFRRPAPPPPEHRRQFVRRATALGGAMVGGALLLPDEAWAGVEERAARFGIVPGSTVDAAGRPVEGASAYPFLGDIMLTPYNFAVRGFAMCNGQLLPIAQNTALFSLLGTMYGGDGRTTFALPDLRSRYAMGFGRGPGLSDYRQGIPGGVEQVTLSIQQLAAHGHNQPVTNSVANTRTPNSNVPAKDSGTDLIYGQASGGNSFEPTTATGGGQGHTNLAPFIALNYQIATVGQFPSRS